MSDLDRLAQARAVVHNMPGYYADLDRLVSANGGTGLREKVSTSRTWAPLVINEDVTELRADIVAHLHAWACRVARDAAFSEPTFRAPVRTARFILDGWRWVESAAWCDNLVDDMLDLSDRINGRTTPKERHKVVDRIHDGLIDGRDVASALSVSPSLVRQWVASGELTPRERGPNGRNLYNLDDIRTLKIRRDMARQIADGDIAA
jgi:hypothetical protein